MKKLIRYWNQNRIKVIITIFIIVFILVLISVINNIISQVQDNTMSNTSEIIDTAKPSESVISGDSVSDEVTEANMDIIRDFVEYCNNKEYENAYKLLTEDCKSELFPNLQTFIDNYYNQIFDKKITYSLELWYYSSEVYTYRITYKEDNLLETGIVNSGSNKEDYITVVKEDNGDKLNISNFIGKEKINKEVENKGIKITISERIRFKNYERYIVEIVNNSNNTVLISEGIDSNDICLVDTNETEYDCMLNEISLTDLELEPYSRKNINISFYKSYNSYRAVESMMFKNIILDKQLYEVDPNNATRISINIVI